jgi:hypothetical protein
MLRIIYKKSLLVYFIFKRALILQARYFQAQTEIRVFKMNNTFHNFENVGQKHLKLILFLEQQSLENEIISSGQLFKDKY